VIDVLYGVKNNALDRSYLFVCGLVSAGRILGSFFKKDLAYETINKNCREISDAFEI
jgi:hypothetical protein